MRPQLELCPGRVLLALGAVGLGSVWSGGAEAEIIPGAAAAPDAAQASTLTLNGLPGVSDAPGILLGGELAPIGVPAAGRGSGAAISAWTPRRNLLVGGSISVEGTLRPRAQGRRVGLQERRGAGWVTMASASTSRLGQYRLGFRPPAPGSLALRVRFSGDRISGPATTPLGVVNVYRLAGASWYGGGGPLACGGTLTDARLGVAHKTLPCGTMVALHLGKRTVRVPVIDRGPYVSGRDYDLTPATKRALGFGDTGAVWATR